MDKDFDYFLELFFVLTVVFILAGIPILDKATCEAKARAMHCSCDWGLLQGCMIEPDPGSNEWVPLENFRKNKGENDVERRKNNRVP